MRFFIFFFLIFGSSLSLANTCADPKLVQRKIDQLKVEVSCSSEASLHTCAELLHSQKHISKELPHSHDTGCEVGVMPLTSPIASLAEKIVGEEHLLEKYHGNWYVNSVEDFYEHTRLHTERVKTLGLDLYRSHPELFQGLTKEQVELALSAHDRAKLSPKAIAANGKPFYQALYENYRSSPDHGVIRELNDYDEKFMNDAYKMANLHDNPSMTQEERQRRKILREKLKRIERIADFVDRGSSPVSSEEFGRPMKAASSFLTDPVEKDLAKELESKYQRLTSHLEYKVLSNPERRSLGRKIRMEAKFASIVKKQNIKSISARAMASQILKKGQKGFLRVLGALGSSAAKKFFLAADFVGLYFGDMDRLGCANVGYHDWIKDPNCEPAIGLTPKFIEFLNEDFSHQMSYLKYQPSTCKVLSETYQESIEKPKVKSCASNSVELEIGEKNHLKVKLDARRRMSEVELGRLGFEINDYFRGVPEKVLVNSSGIVSKVCYYKTGRDQMRSCIDSSTQGAKEDLNKVNEFMKSINFQIQKAIASCSSST